MGVVAQEVPLMTQMASGRAAGHLRAPSSTAFGIRDYDAVGRENGGFFKAFAIEPEEIAGGFHRQRFTAVDGLCTEEGPAEPRG